MSGTTTHSPQENPAVSCQLRIPMLWSEAAAAPLPGENLHLQNCQRLQAIEALETSGAPKNEQPTGTEAELQRLESKLNLALDLLGTLLDQSVPRPQPRYLELSAQSATWQQTDGLKTGARGRLSLYLHPLLAQPVVLPAEITGCEELGETEGYRVSCRFDPMPDDLSDAFLAYVFRGHRRAVAEQRLQASSENSDSGPSTK